MEYLTGKTEKKTLGIQDILAGEYEGKEVTVNGAVHKIRDMGVASSGEMLYFS